MSSGIVSPPGTHPLRNTISAERTVNHLLRSAARAEPDRVVVETEAGCWTRADLLDRVRRTATFLRQSGVGPGDRVGVMAANRIEILEIMLACGWIGAVFVPYNPANRGASLVHQLTLSEPQLIIVDDDSRRPLDDSLRTARQQDRCAEVTVSGFPPTLPVEAAEEEPAVEPSTLLALLWTSGTTGPAKAVEIPQGQFFWWPVVVAEEMSLTDQDVLYTCLPMYHTNALTTPLQALACGGRAFLGPHFSVSRHWERLSAAGATVTYLLGAMGSMLWNRRPHTLPPLKLERVLGGGMNVGIKLQFEEHFGVEVLEGFGMTEVGVPIYTPTGDHQARGMGLAHPDYEVAVVDDTGEDVGVGATGELVIRHRRPNAVSRGYWRNEKVTLESRENLWFHTGDLASRDDGGYFHFVGRRSDSIRRRGENISAFEVETALGSIRGVEQCAAYAVPSALGEDEVMVSVVRSDLGLTAQLLVDEAALVLAAHEIPRFVRFIEELPLTGNGKIKKSALRDLGVTDDAWDREEAVTASSDDQVHRGGGAGRDPGAAGAV